MFEFLTPWLAIADDALKLGKSWLDRDKLKLEIANANEIDSIEDEIKRCLDRGNPSDILRAKQLSERKDRKIAERERIAGPSGG